MKAHSRLYYSLDRVLVMLSVCRFPEEGNPVLQHIGVRTYRELSIIIFIVIILLSETGIVQSV